MHIAQSVANVFAVLVSQAGFAYSLLFFIHIFLLFHYHCRYLHRGTSPKMSTLHHAERNSKECDTSRRGARGSIFCYIMRTRQANSKLRSTNATSITGGVAFRVQAPNFYCCQRPDEQVL